MSTTHTINSVEHVQRMHVRVFSKESAVKIAQLGKKALEALLRLIIRLSRVIATPFRIGSSLAVGKSAVPMNIGISPGESLGAGPIESTEPFHRKRKFPTPIVESSTPEIAAKLSDLGLVNDEGASDATLFGLNQGAEVISPGNVLDGKYDVFLVLEGAPDDLKQAYQPILERISLVLDWTPNQLNFGEFNDEAIANIVEVAEDLERLQVALKLTETQMLLVSQNVAKSVASEYDSKQNDVLSYIIEMQQKGATQDTFHEGSVEGDLFRIASLASRFRTAIAAREDFLVEILNQTISNPELHSRLKSSIADCRIRIREKTGTKPVQVETAQEQRNDGDKAAIVMNADEPQTVQKPVLVEAKPKVVGGMFSNSVDSVSVPMDDSDCDLTEETEFVG